MLRTSTVRVSVFALVSLLPLPFDHARAQEPVFGSACEVLEAVDLETVLGITSIEYFLQEPFDFPVKMSSCAAHVDGQVVFGLMIREILDEGVYTYREDLHASIQSEMSEMLGREVSTEPLELDVPAFWVEDERLLLLFFNDQRVLLDLSSETSPFRSHAISIAESIIEHHNR